MVDNKLKYIRISGDASHFHGTGRHLERDSSWVVILGFSSRIPISCPYKTITPSSAFGLFPKMCSDYTTNHAEMQQSFSRS